MPGYVSEDSGTLIDNLLSPDLDQETYRDLFFGGSSMYQPSADVYSPYQGPSSIENTGEFDYGLENTGVIPTTQNELVQYMLQMIPSMSYSDAITLSNSMELYDLDKEQDLASRFGLEMTSIDEAEKIKAQQLSEQYLSSEAVQSRSTLENLITGGGSGYGRDVARTEMASQSSADVFRDTRQIQGRESNIQRVGEYSDLQADVREARMGYLSNEETNLLNQILKLAEMEGMSSDDWTEEYMESLERQDMSDGTFYMQGGTNIATQQNMTGNPYGDNPSYSYASGAGLIQLSGQGSLGEALPQGAYNAIMWRHNLENVTQNNTATGYYKLPNGDIYNYIFRGWQADIPMTVMRVEEGTYQTEYDMPSEGSNLLVGGGTSLSTDAPDFDYYITSNFSDFG